jgi:xanthine/uracil permease
MTKYETEEENRDKRAAVLVIPAYLIGKAVVQSVFFGLVTVYGLYMVRQAGITIKGNYCFVIASILLLYSYLVETEPPWGQLFRRDRFVYSLHRLN